MLENIHKVQLLYLMFWEIVQRLLYILKAIHTSHLMLTVETFAGYHVADGSAVLLTFLPLVNLQTNI